jgi:hypothetical protein
VTVKVAEPKQIAGKGKVNDDTMLSAVRLINTEAPALDPVKMSFPVSGPEQNLSRIEMPDRCEQFDYCLARLRPIQLALHWRDF